MRFFFSRKGKKNVSLNTTRVLRAFFFALSLSLFLSLSPRKQKVKVIFEGRRETAFSAAVLLQSSSRARLCRRVSLLFLFSFVVSVCILKESEEERKGKKRPKRRTFFLSLNQISTQHTANKKKTSERSTTATTFKENAQKDRRADIFFFS